MPTKDRLIDIKNDIVVGIIIALVTIPISMGYAEVSGIPARYGLLGSVFPILLFGILTTSPRFVFGVDAAPAALMGGMVYAFGITPGTYEAMNFVPAVTLLVSMWLMLFAFLDMSKVIRYISKPVMEGFITGISCEIILMQVPKLFGGSAGIGELFTLIPHIKEQMENFFNPCSFVLGMGTIVIILVAKKKAPKLPMTVILMFAGAMITKAFHIERFGVNLLPQVETGIPEVIIPNLRVLSGFGVKDILIGSLSIALVITAESLLATSSYAQKYGDRITGRREIFGYAAGNLASALCGCCPVNGSVSRTGIAEQFGVKSQVMSITAAVTMFLILDFGTGFIQYLPVPVLTGIVISALIGILEFKMAHSLKKVDKTEWFIFYAVFFAVLILGTVYGVLAGIIMSFVTVIIRAASPPVEFMGMIEGRDGFYSLNRIKNARPIDGVIIYRFNGSLFFANIDKFQRDLETSAQEYIKVIIVDARGIGSLDITAAERLVSMEKYFKERGIKFYLTEHSGAINDQLRAFNAGDLIDRGVVRKSIETALNDAGYFEPFKLLDDNHKDFIDLSRKLQRDVLDDKKIHVDDETTAEFQWAYGKDADEKMQVMAAEFAKEIMEKQKVEDRDLMLIENQQINRRWSNVELSNFLDLIEMQLALMAKRRKGLDHSTYEKDIEDRIVDLHVNISDRISRDTKSDIRKLAAARIKNERRFRREHPEAYSFFKEERKLYRNRLEKEHPELAERIDKAREQIKESDAEPEHHMLTDILDHISDFIKK